MTKTFIGKVTLAPALLAVTGALIAAPASETSTLKNQHQTGLTVITPEPAKRAEASQLLERIQANAVQLEKDSGALASSSGLKLSRQSQANYLMQVRERINQNGKQLASFEKIKAEAAPWQQQAYNRITPIARDLARNTEAAINHLNENPAYRFAPQYQDTLQAIAVNAGEMKDNVNAFLALGAAQQKVHTLQQELAESRS